MNNVLVEFPHCRSGSHFTCCAFHVITPPPLHANKKPTRSHHHHHQIPLLIAGDVDGFVHIFNLRSARQIVLLNAIVELTNSSSSSTARANTAERSDDPFLCPVAYRNENSSSFFDVAAFLNLNLPRTPHGILSIGTCTLNHPLDENEGVPTTHSSNTLLWVHSRAQRIVVFDLDAIMRKAQPASSFSGSDDDDDDDSSQSSSSDDGDREDFDDSKFVRPVQMLGPLRNFSFSPVVCLVTQPSGRRSSPGSQRPFLTFLCPHEVSKPNAAATDSQISSMLQYFCVIRAEPERDPSSSSSSSTTMTESKTKKKRNQMMKNRRYVVGAHGVVDFEDAFSSSEDAHEEEQDDEAIFQQRFGSSSPQPKPLSKSEQAKEKPREEMKLGQIMCIVAKPDRVGKKSSDCGGSNNNHHLVAVGFEGGQVGLLRISTSVLLGSEDRSFFFNVSHRVLAMTRVAPDPIMSVAIADGSKVATTSINSNIDCSSPPSSSSSSSVALLLLVCGSAEGSLSCVSVSVASSRNEGGVVPWTQKMPAGIGHLIELSPSSASSSGVHVFGALLWNGECKQVELRTQDDDAVSTIGVVTDASQRLLPTHRTSGVALSHQQIGAVCFSDEASVIQSCSLRGASSKVRSVMTLSFKTGSVLSIVGV